MIKIGIMPVLYDGRRLREIGNNVTAVFERVIDGFFVHPDVARLYTETLGTESWKALDMPFEKNGTRFFADSREFNKFLGRFGPYTLGITSVNTFNEEGGAPGDASGNYLTAHVVSDPLYFGDFDTNEYVRRLSNVAVHEMGHLFGLEHHDKKVTLDSGKACSMVPPELVGFTSYPRIYDNRGTEFCGDCRETLKEAEKALKNLSVHHMER